MLDLTDAHALIFDCDGTLADTMPAHYRAWDATLRRYELPFSEERFYAWGGMPSDRIIRRLAEEYGRDVDAVAVSHEKENAFLAFLDEVRPMRAVVEIASRYVGRLPLAVASGGYRDIVSLTLRNIGVLDWFPIIVTAEDTAKHKPEPDVFLEAARRLAVAPAGCVVFEDTDIGLEAARRAGMRGIDIRQLAGVTSRAG